MSFVEFSKSRSKTFLRKKLDHQLVNQTSTSSEEVVVSLTGLCYPQKLANQYSKGIRSTNIPLKIRIVDNFEIEVVSLIVKLVFDFAVCNVQKQIQKRAQLVILVF